MESIFEALLSTAIYWLPALGVISVCMTRMSDLGWRQNLCQGLCFAFVVLPILDYVVYQIPILQPPRELKPSFSSVN